MWGRVGLGWAVMGALAALIAMSGCIDDRCGPKLVYREGVCAPALADAAVPLDAEALDAEAADGVASDARASDAVAADADVTSLGDACKSDLDCKGLADFCALQPGATGYCTITGCDPTKAGSCPAGFYCLDLTIFDPKLPTICAK